MNRQLDWVKAIASIHEEMGKFNINIQDLDRLTQEEYNWFLALLERTSQEITSLREAVSNTIESHPLDG